MNGMSEIVVSAAGTVTISVSPAAEGKDLLWSPCHLHFVNRNNILCWLEPVL